MIIIESVQLREAAKRDVGTDVNQIPDMSGFGSSLSAKGYQKLPSGLILQWGRFDVASTSGSVGTADVTFPIAFPNAFLSPSALVSTNDPSVRPTGFDAQNTNAMKIRFTYVSTTANAIYWHAIGY